MNSPALNADLRRDIRQSTRSLRRRLSELHDGFRHPKVEAALEALYTRSAENQRIDFDSLTGDEAALLLLSLEQTVTRQLIGNLEQLELNQQDAAGN